MTTTEIEAGTGCFYDRDTFIYTDENGNLETSESANAHIPGFWFCGRRDQNGNILWC